MSLRELPQASLPNRPQNFQWDIPSDVLAAWADMPQLATAGDAASISIFDTIGEDMWSDGGGFTSRRASAALRSIGPNPVTVNISSRGGDMFEGIAIYNLLAAHPAKVTVNVMGLAASAASIIAMAGDHIAMGDGAQLMIHNAWGVIVGNANDMRAAADVFAGFDSALADIYRARTGMKASEISSLMDAETFIPASQAISLGFADGMLTGSSSSARAETPIDPALRARRQTEAALARDGHTRADRHRMINAMLEPSRDASSAPTAARDAGIRSGLNSLIDIFSI